MTKTELIDKIENGSDIMFDVENRHFTIFTWMDEGIGIGEQHRRDKMQYFTSANDLVENFKIDGSPLSSLAGKVVITDYT